MPGDSARTSTSTDDFDIESHIPGAFPETPSRTPAFSTQQSLSEALYNRRSEYTRPRNVRIKIGTWNVAALKGTEKDVAGWFIEGRGIEEALTGDDLNPDNQVPKDKETVEVQEQRRSKHQPTIPKNDAGGEPAGEEIGLYVLGLQEVVDISSPVESLRPYTDPGPANKFKYHVADALPLGYSLVAEQQLLGLLLLIYASPSVSQDVKAVSTTSVGTGVMGVMGNKGAVTARIVLGETTRIVFVDCHLSAGADKASLDRRNWDTAQITSRTRFDPIDDILGISQSTGETIGEEDFAFWFGDLNYRLEGMPGEDIRRLLMLHTRNEYDIGQSKSATKIDDEISETESMSESTKSERSSRKSGESSRSSTPTKATNGPSVENEDVAHEELNPMSLQATIQSLLPHDELHQQMRTHKAFYDGWKEGPIRFLPTYKYDVGSVGMFDSSDKKRCPSWCDRILYRTRRAYQAYQDQAEAVEEARKRDEEMKAQSTDEAADDENVLFDYDPEEDAEEYNEELYTQEPQTTVTKEGFEDEIQLEYYVAHQRVLSSDHKPLDAIFNLKYDAVIPETKARIHQEVVRELDRAENEGRPTITVIVDKPYNEDDLDGSQDDSIGAVNFGTVHMGERKHRTITVANTGAVPATMTFVDRPVSNDQVQGPHPIWLSVHWDREPDPRTKKSKEPPSYTLEPGDACIIELTVRIEIAELIKSLNEGTTKLDDILILRVKGGRDHFLPVQGKWVHSGLERASDKMKGLAEDSIRRLQHQRPEGSSSPKLGNENRPDSRGTSRTAMTNRS